MSSTTSANDPQNHGDYNRGSTTLGAGSWRGHEITYDFETQESKVEEEEENVVAEASLETKDLTAAPVVHFDVAASTNGNKSGDTAEDDNNIQRSRRRSSGWRKDHLRSLIVEQKAMIKYSSMKVLQTEGSSTTSDSVQTEDTAMRALLSEAEEGGDLKKVLDGRLKFITQKMISQVKYTFPMEVRISNLTFSAQTLEQQAKIQTVYNASPIYKLQQLFRSSANKTVVEKKILNDINLVLQPGKMYLLLGSPGSGKSSLLKAIAGRLLVNNKTTKLQGSVAYNGKTLKDKSKYHIDNAVAYIDQLDRHAARLSVEETFEFAFQCKTGGVAPFQAMEKSLEKAAQKEGNNNKSSDEQAASEQQQQRGPLITRVALGLETLGLTHVKDTFVGDENVRGVSGGQRRRVTVGEMIMDRAPLLCGDEISTGLDSTSTYDMIDLMTYYGRLSRTTRVIALLQPSPETVSLFDEVLVLAEGQFLYAGPIEDVQDYFESLGYCPPDQMDVADFLQVLSTPDAKDLWKAPEGSNRTEAYTVSELADCFRQSQHNQRILEELKAPQVFTWDATDEKGNQTSTAFLAYWPGVRSKYANSFPRAIWLNLKRSLTLWIRDRRVLIANFAKNAIMGISVGGVFYQTEDVVSILGVLFQSMLFIMLGASTAAPALVDDRAIFKKHYQANFFSAYPFIIGRTISQMPQTLMDVLVFGSILYFMVGLYLSIENYAIFISILFTFAMLINQLLAVFAAAAPSQASVQLFSSVILLFSILFGGFIVPPSVIPKYYEWIYWWNPFAWAYRALLVLEFRSPDWENPDAILEGTGFTYGPDNVAFGKEWVGYGFAYMVPTFIIYLLLTALCLQIAASASNHGGSSNSAENKDDENEGGGDKNETEVAIPFTTASLSFEDICYDVSASKGKDKLRLLTEVNGIFESGRMCALMGSSGAGKTTLMDVIAMRKNTGTVTGNVYVNGFPQDKISFRRSSGYVEQFDVQSPELTVLETILFSSRLRLDPEKVTDDQQKVAFVNQLIRTLELTPLTHSLVGTSESGGLTFEQKKRLSIAVELAAAPSILFLDEPTSGLDARSAFLVVKLLRKIASDGRTICATIHQPSSAVFEMFDDLLLLKKGGRVVYFGELGNNSSSLIKYFEDRGARAIDIGENPANWVLTVMTSDTKDFADEYLESEQYKMTKENLSKRTSDPDSSKKLHYENEFATSKGTRSRLTNKRLTTIYWRSPNYNLSRMLVSAVIAIVMSSVLVPERTTDEFTETEMRAQFAVIFLSFIIIGIMSIFSVLPVMLSIRDMFYRHRASGMIGSGSLGWALGTAEKWFIVVTSIIFVVIFLTVSYSGDQALRGRIEFWGFFTFNLAIYSYFGQAFVCFFKPMATAQILSSVFIGLNNFFSGLIVRPQFMTGLFEITYWITPGHYVYEGMVTALFNGDTRAVVADRGSDFFIERDCETQMMEMNTTTCVGTVEEYMDIFFGGKFKKEHNGRNLIILGFILTLSRILTFLALHYINFSAT